VSCASAAQGLNKAHRLGRNASSAIRVLRATTDWWSKLGRSRNASSAIRVLRVNAAKAEAEATRSRNASSAIRVLRDYRGEESIMHDRKSQCLVGHSCPARKKENA